MEMEMEMEMEKEEYIIYNIHVSNSFEILSEISPETTIVNYISPSKQKKLKKFYKNVSKKNFEENCLILWLPGEIWNEIISFLNLGDLGYLCLTSKFFQNIISKASLPKNILNEDLRDYDTERFLYRILRNKSFYWIDIISAQLPIRGPNSPVSKFFMYNEEINFFMEAIINQDFSSLKFLLSLFQISQIDIDILMSILDKYELFDTIDYIEDCANVDELDLQQVDVDKIKVNPLAVVIFIGNKKICKFILEFIYTSLNSSSNYYRFCPNDNLFTEIIEIYYPPSQHNCNHGRYRRSRGYGSCNSGSGDDDCDCDEESFIDYEERTYGNLDALFQIFCKDDQNDEIYPLFLQIKEICQKKRNSYDFDKRFSF